MSENPTAAYEEGGDPSELSRDQEAEHRKVVDGAVGLPDWQPSAASIQECVVYEASIVVSFEHDNEEDAERVGERMLDRALEHPLAIEGEVTVRRV